MAKNKKRSNKGSSEQTKPNNTPESNGTNDDIQTPASATPIEQSVEENNDATKELEEQLAQLKLQVAEKTKLLDEKDKVIEEKDRKLTEASSVSAEIKDTQVVETNGNTSNNASGASEEVDELKKRLEAAESERDDSKSSYNALLSKLSSMKSVFSKMKEAQVELEETKEQLSSHVDENSELKEKVDSLTTSNSQLHKTVEKLREESNDLNSECDRLTSSLTALRREYQSKDDTLQDEKYDLENANSRLSKKINELKAELNEIKLAESEMKMENKTLLLNIEELEDKLGSKDIEINTLQDIISQYNTTVESKNSMIESITAESRKSVESANSIVEVLKAEKSDLENKINENLTRISSLEGELSNLDEIKAEVNSKQLLIGKLRHEAIILNEHLTKALTMLKQQSGSSNNTIDKELISNVIISFLQFPRGDSKKFEALQLISALLEWDEHQKISAGLSHSQGTKTSQDAEKSGRQNFVSLWTDFLEKESSGK